MAEIEKQSCGVIGTKEDNVHEEEQSPELLPNLVPESPSSSSESSSSDHSSSVEGEGEDIQPTEEEESFLSEAQERWRLKFRTVRLACEGIVFLVRLFVGGATKKIFGLVRRSLVGKYLLGNLIPSKVWINKAGPIFRALQKLRFTHPVSWISFLVSFGLQYSNAATKTAEEAKSIVLWLFFSLVVHEIGHILVLLALEVEFYPVVFVPFIGAFVTPKGHPTNIQDEALIAAGGPILGTVVAVWLGVASFLPSHNQHKLQVVLQASSLVAYQLNSFNMGCWGALDGARILQVVSPFLTMMASIYYVLGTDAGRNMGLEEGIRLFLGVRESFFRMWKHHEDNEEEGLPVGPLYYEISWFRRIVVLVCYGMLFFLINFLGEAQRQMMTTIMLMADHEVGSSSNSVSSTSFLWCCFSAVFYTLGCAGFFGYVLSIRKFRLDVFDAIEFIPVAQDEEEEEEPDETQEQEVDSDAQEPSAKLFTVEDNKDHVKDKLL